MKNESDKVHSFEPFDLTWKFRCGGGVIGVSISDKKGLISAASIDKSGYLIDFKGNLCWQKNLDHPAWNTEISENGDIVTFCTASKFPVGGSVFIFDIKGNFVDHIDIKAPVWDVAVSEDGCIIYASSWNNQIYCFERTNGKYNLRWNKPFGKVGIYGCSTDHKGEIAIASLYELGPIWLNSKGEKIKSDSLGEGLYGASLSKDGQIAAFGSANGKVFLYKKSRSKRLSISVSQKQICGVAHFGNGKLIVCGSFDGKIYLIDSRGRIIWNINTWEEVWGVDITNDGKMICAGSGDSNVYMIKNNFLVKNLEETINFEKEILNDGRNFSHRKADALFNYYIEKGLITYGLDNIKKSKKIKKESPAANIITEKLLLAKLTFDRNDYESHYELGILYKKRGEIDKAISELQIAGRNPELRLKAFYNVAGCFIKNNNFSLAINSLKIGLENRHIGSESMPMFYQLARLYEKVENFEESKKLYEMLASIDINYKDVKKKLNQDISKKLVFKIDEISEKKQKLKDVILTKIDPSLWITIKARMKEFSSIATYEERLKSVLDLMIGIPESYEIQKKGVLSYDKVAYFKYEYGSIEDEIKKNLEMAYIIDAISNINKIRYTLDIGCATGRYPIFFSKIADLAIGVDQEKTSIELCNKKKNLYGLENVEFRYMDAAELKFEDKKFNVITCMMGTFSHFKIEERNIIIQEMKRVLNDEGIMIISTWDVDCPYLNFLGMYPAKIKRIIKQNSLNKHGFKRFVEQQGLKLQGIKNFCMFPDSFYYELDFVRIDKENLKKVLYLDEAAKLVLPNMLGQMFLAIISKDKSAAYINTQKDN